MNFKKDVLPLLIALIIASVFIELLKFGIEKLTSKNSYDDSDIIGDYPTDELNSYDEEDVYYED